MKDSTDIDNVRIRFKFDAVENSFNLFHIQSPDLGECLYMKTSRYCKYSRAFHGQTGALWRVIQVKIHLYFVQRSNHKDVYTWQTQLLDVQKV